MCTHTKIVSADGVVVTGRTMEGAFEMDADLAFLPRGLSFVGLTPTGAAGHPWTNRYAYAGASAFAAPGVLDGLNEKGLAAGAFFFPGCVGYQAMAPGDELKTLSQADVVDYLLGNCATADEAAEAIRDVLVASVEYPGAGALPLHYPVVDASGSGIVIEHVDGELHVHDNPLGVCTNAPSFDWHLKNLHQYVHLDPTDAGPRTFEGYGAFGWGNGTGMLGLPGDFTPPSRFVRMAAFTDAAPQPKSASEAVDRVFHLLNHFDIPTGAVVGVVEGNSGAERTLYTAVRDQSNLRYYVSSEECRGLSVLDLNALDLDGNEILRTGLLKEQAVTDVTAQLAVASAATSAPATPAT